MAKFRSQSQISTTHFFINPKVDRTPPHCHSPISKSKAKGSSTHHSRTPLIKLICISILLTPISTISASSSLVLPLQLGLL
ncbi:uncharacterized protein G2W53_029083 [Senna tora]|uniref:Uncharacterized protein n=1 Tax=Senna tora TaxID=362788 RepID=A0A834TDD2_9FABA|nr:uncharacterized protein G2W53_029083 [Senna tora]